MVCEPTVPRNIGWCPRLRHCRVEDFGLSSESAEKEKRERAGLGLTEERVFDCQPNLVDIIEARLGGIAY